jgi:hypothetical protein
VRMLLEMAQEHQWPHGAALDPECRNQYREVIYIETPKGQVSFHVWPGSCGRLEPHTKPWTGVRNSHIVLAKLFGQKVKRKGR